MILIADDSQFQRDWLSIQFKKCDIEHMTATCGCHAFQMLQWSYDKYEGVQIAILDYRIDSCRKCLTGADVVKLWKDKYPYRPITFIGFSSDKDLKGDVKRLFESVFKKNHPHALIEEVKTQLNKIHLS